MSDISRLIRGISTTNLRSNSLVQISIPVEIPKGEIIQRSTSNNDDNNKIIQQQPIILRTKSDQGPKLIIEDDDNNNIKNDNNNNIRHGFENQLINEEQTDVLSQGFYMYWTDKRPINYMIDNNNNNNDNNDINIIDEWRMKDRLKCVGAIIAICLNLGVDPPDIIKTDPCARTECWIDPLIDVPQQSSPTTILTNIGQALQSKYEILSIRTKYKIMGDPTVEDLKKICINMRKNSKDERILFHYNGHGVPKPTIAGELWAFNKSFTQYIPIPIYDLQSWLGSPTLYVYDCNAAGMAIKNFILSAERHEREDNNINKINYKNCIHLGSCREDENLPINPDLPGDFFTCCLITPMEMAIKYFILQNPLKDSPILKRNQKIPGKLTERRTPLGELNWIFTAITDTIAWNSLPSQLFKKLFRQDLMVAALFRNFLLAQRIMKTYNCNPISYPKLINMYNHKLWSSWDYVLEILLKQLPLLIKQEENGQELLYKSSDFFSQQLSAFEIYLSSNDALIKKIPEQLPIVLQVLLSQSHRLRALILLSKFLDLGPWAVNLALSIGIFPYILKLLQSQAQELKSIMIFIWTRILAVDITCQNDLIKDNGYQYFVNLLNPKYLLQNCPNISEHKAMCFFIISMFIKDYKPSQLTLLSSTPQIIEYIIFYLKDDDYLTRQYSLLCLSLLWKDFTESKWLSLKYNIIFHLSKLVYDPVPEVRISLINSLTNFLGIPDLTDQVAENEKLIAELLLPMGNDGNIMVRQEYLIFLSTFVKRYKLRFLSSSFDDIFIERKRQLNITIDNHNNIYLTCWRQILILSNDPHIGIKENSNIILDNILYDLLKSKLGSLSLYLINIILNFEKLPFINNHQQENNNNDNFLLKDNIIKRTTSYATFQFFNNKSNNIIINDNNNNNDNNKNIKLPFIKNFISRNNNNMNKLEELPLKSSFILYCIKYFREPQMRPSEIDEPGSENYNQRLWRRTRNDYIISETQPISSNLNLKKWSLINNNNNINNNDVIIKSSLSSSSSSCSKLLFHQFENHLLLSDFKNNNISIWDWKNSLLINKWSNNNPKNTKITSLKFVNEDDIGLILSGSSDGIIKIYKNYTEKVELVTAFRALTDLVPTTSSTANNSSSSSTGLICEWQQGKGHLLIGGDVKIIKIWDADKELCISDIPARSKSNITFITSDQVEGNLFMSGYGDGAIRIFDKRLHPSESMIKVYKEHQSWIAGLSLQRGGLRELISAEKNGIIKLWDIRLNNSIGIIKGILPNNNNNNNNNSGTSLRTLSVHEHAPLFATGSSHNSIKLFSTNHYTNNLSTSSTPITNIEPFISTSLLSSTKHNQKIPIQATAFHPHRLILACSMLDEPGISIYKCQS